MRTSLRALALLALTCTATERLAAQAKDVVVYVVRHSEKVADGSADPHLSPAGEARAKALDAVLGDSGITTVVLTQWQRTKETAAPFLVAHKANVVTMQVAANTVAEHAVAVAATALHAPGPVLVIGHSNTIPAVIAALGGTGKIVVCDAQYAELFVVRRKAGDSTATVTRSHFGAADPVGAERCP